MQDPSPNWTSYIEALEAQAVRLPRRHPPPAPRSGVWSALLRRLGYVPKALLRGRRRDIDG